MLTSHFKIPEGAAMLEEKTYTLPQIAEVLGGPQIVRVFYPN